MVSISIKNSESALMFFDVGHQLIDPIWLSMIYLLDLLDSLLRLQLSWRHMDIIIWVMKITNCEEVPTLHALQVVQEDLHHDGPGIPTNCFKSSVGNIMYMNDIPHLIVNVCILQAYEWDGDLIKIQEYANAQVSSLLHFYPEEANGTISEFWHADQLKELPPELLTLMYCKGFKDFYVDELAELKTGELMIPHMWIIWEGVMCVDVHKVTLIHVRPLCTLL